MTDQTFVRYWLGTETDADSVFSGGFTDEKLLSEPLTIGVFLVEEHFLMAAEIPKPGVMVLRVTFVLSDAEMARYVIRFGGWPTGGCVIPASVLNTLQPKVERVSRRDVLALLSERGSAWAQQWEVEGALTELKPSDEHD